MLVALPSLMLLSPPSSILLRLGLLLLGAHSWLRSALRLEAQSLKAQSSELEARVEFCRLLLLVFVSFERASTHFEGRRDQVGSTTRDQVNRNPASNSSTSTPNATRQIRSTITQLPKGILKTRPNSTQLKLNQTNNNPIRTQHSKHLDTPRSTACLASKLHRQAIVSD